MEYISRNSELGNNDFDGVIQLQDLTGQSALVNNNPIEPFYYDASGDGRIRPFKGIRANIKKRKEQRFQRRQDRQARRNERVSAKTMQAKANLAAAKSLSKSDNITNAALSQPAITEEPKKSNTALYIGLGIAGLAVVGAIVYFVVKGKNKNK